MGQNGSFLIDPSKKHRWAKEELVLLPPNVHPNVTRLNTPGRETTLLVLSGVGWFEEELEPNPPAGYVPLMEVFH